MSAVQVFWKHFGEKEKLLITTIFFMLPQCFLPFYGTPCSFYAIWNCRLQTLTVWKSLEFVFGKGVTLYYTVWSYNDSKY